MYARSRKGSSYVTDMVEEYIEEFLILLLEELTAKGSALFIAL